MNKLVLLMVLAVVFTACGPAKDPIADKEKPVVILNCSQNMTEYKVEGTSVKFCYDKEWGEPVVEDVKAKAGTAMEISFDKFSKDNPLMVWIESKDFMPAEGEKRVKFEFMNAMQSDEEKLIEQLKNAAGYEGNIRARKSDVGGVRAIRAEVEGRLEYFVPDAFYEHHVVISGSLPMAEEIDNFVFDMAF